MKKPLKAFAVVAVACVFCVVLAAEENFDQFNVPADVSSDRPGENVALGKSYALSPAPNYRYCTEAGDMTQLTDGEYVEGYFWTQPGTVGWANTNPAVIVLDLGEVQPIRGLSIHTAAGRAGVSWPLAIEIFVADEAGKFHFIGDLVELSAAHDLPPAHDYATHRYWTDALETHGRYVGIAVNLQSFFFTDEIEVYAGEAALLDRPLPGQEIGDMNEAVMSRTMEASIKRRLRADALSVAERLGKASINEDARKQLNDKLEMVRQRIDSETPEYTEDFRTVLPLNELHQDIFAVNGALWQAEGYGPITVWQTPLWEWLDLFAEPLNDALRVKVLAMNGEYRAGAFNISNASTAETTVRLDIEGLPEPITEYVRVSEVAWTDTLAGTPVAAALPEALRDSDGWRITLPAGMTRQVWLSFHPENLPSGLHEGSIHVSRDGFDATIPLTLRVLPMSFPERPSLHFGGWDYTNSDSHYEVRPENKAALISMLREYYVDSPWATNAVIPEGVFDSEGNMTTAPSTERFDAWLAQWPDARQYLVFAAIGDHIGQHAMGTPAFDRAVQAHANFWANHCNDRGVAPERMAWLLLDEPHNAEQQEIILAWQRAMDAAGTGIRIWEDPTFDDVAVANQEMLSRCDVLCPNRPIFLKTPDAYRDLFLTKRDEGVALEFYSCSGPVRTLDPYSYHRLQAWDCWRFGAQSSYFWAFGDSGGSWSWNEYRNQRNGYTPLFIDGNGVTPGKHLEACREGIQDYEYLVMLEQAIAKAKDAGRDDAAVREAQSLLDTLPLEVCQEGYLPSFYWPDELDRTRADLAREKIAEALVALEP